MQLFGCTLLFFFQLGTMRENAPQDGSIQFPALIFGWVVITTLYHLMLQSWYQKTAYAIIGEHSRGIYKSRLQWCLYFFCAFISFFFHLTMVLVYITEMYMNHIIYLCESLAFKQTQITQTLAIKKIGYFVFHL